MREDRLKVLRCSVCGKDITRRRKMYTVEDGIKVFCYDCWEKYEQENSIWRAKKDEKGRCL